MKKRLSSLLLAAALVLSLPGTGALAAAVPSTEEAAQVLAALDIMVGDQNGDLHLGDSITRAEFTKMTVAASTFAEGVGGQSMVSPYPDVTARHWAAGYVQAAVEHGLINGYTDGTFKPDHQITLAEGVTMVLRLLGYTSSDFSGAYPSGQLNLYRRLGLQQGVSVTEAAAPLSRQDTLYLFYNLLTARTKTGQVYLTTLGHSLTPSGEIDRVALVNSAMDGPVLARGDWQSVPGFDLGTAKVYRGGKAVSLGDIRTGDVVYWSKSMRTLWAYSDRVTGTYQSASPSVSSPSSVTVAGNVYPIETASAAYDLSDLGAFPLGSTVTLLLGRSGGVAAVLSPEDLAADDDLYGVVTALGTAVYTDVSGSRYSAETVTLTGTGGRSYSYQWPTSSFRVGDVVRVARTGASVTLSAASSGSLSGTVNGSATALGQYTFASDLTILETVGDTGVYRVYPSRLAGVTLSGDRVRFYALNSRGELSALILKDVTGDSHIYGVLTDVQETAAGMNLLGVYEYDVNGVPGAVRVSNKLYSVRTGPFGLAGSPAAVERLYNLTAVSLQSAGSGSCTGTDGRTYRTGDNVAVYEQRLGEYSATTLSRVEGKSLTGYYDKPESEGGRIRVIVAR